MLEKLTDREREVAGLVHAGKPQKEIAAALGITRSGVASTLNRICLKLGVTKTSALVLIVERDNNASA